MIGKLLCWCAVSLGCAAWATAQSDARPELDPLFVVEVPAPDGWGEAPQAIGANRKGEVFLLRLETLEVHAVGSGPELGKPRKLEAAGLPRPGSFFRAAMGDDAGDWLLLGQELRWFSDGREQALARAEQPMVGGAIAAGDPLLLLEPLRLRMKRGESFDRLPTLARWDGDEWAPFFEEDVAGLGDPASFDGLRARDAAIAVAPDGEVWLASAYAPLVRRLSASGKVLLELRVDEEPHAYTEKELAATRADLEEAARSLSAGSDPARRPVRTTIQLAPGKTLHQAAAVDRDGLVYFVSRDPEKSSTFRLRRWDPTRLVLEEVALPIDLPGGSTMAFGKAGLHLAHWSASTGRLFVPREELDAAVWREVEGVSMDGVAVPADRRGEL